MNTEPDLDAISGFPATLNLEENKSKNLRYGENPHQQAALYGSFLDYFEQLQGKELSYNNIIDISAAAYLIGEFERPTVAILKHTNPCGVASAENISDAWDKAFATDRQAPFGGIIVVNNTLDIDLAQKIGEIFLRGYYRTWFHFRSNRFFLQEKELKVTGFKSWFWS
jgi:phosphoribosylaminoimidazolecarboxamide formyltransferase/IMP cyclohydrolase